MARLTMVFVLVTVLALVSPLDSRQVDAPPSSLSAEQTCEQQPDDGYTLSITGTVEGDPLDLRISSRFGGAVESLVWRGKEFINIWDHGRQISYAWGMDGYGECLNPTEPGSSFDAHKLTSTTVLLEACQLSESSLSTRAQLAYWLAPGEAGGCAGGAVTAVNDMVLSEHILQKTIEIGYEGIDNIIVFTAQAIMPQAYSNNQLEIPTGYLTYEFTQYWLYNPETNELTKAEGQSITGPWSFQLEGNLPPILSTEDGQYAMGAYSAERVRYYSILGTDNPVPADRTNKWNIVVREEPVFPIAYEYQSFVIIGTLEQVQDAMDELYTLHPADFNPPAGWLDVVNCQEVAGWAWDPKTPGEPIRVEVYDLLADGSETLLSMMTADNPRGDLVNVLGDNGEHGFRFETASLVHDDQPHTLRVYAVNSDERLANPYLFGATQPITCPQFRAIATTPPTNTVMPRPSATSAPVSGATATPQAGSRLPCLGGALPMAMVLLALRRRRS